MPQTVHPGCMDAPCEERFVGYSLLLTPLPSRVVHVEAPQSCSCWSACPHSALYAVLLSFVPLTLLLAVCFICIYILLLSRDYEILTASTACMYQAWSLIPGCNSKMPLQEQIVNGYKRSPPASWMPDTLSLSYQFCFCAPSPLTSQDWEEWAGLSLEQWWQNSARNTESLH